MLRPTFVPVVYVCAEPERQMNIKRLSPEEGVAIAQIAALAVPN